MARRKPSPTSSLRSLTALAICSALATGCDKLSDLTGGAAAAPSSSSTSADPCKTYTDRICAETGASSPTCSAVGSTATLLSPKACTAALADIDHSLQALAHQRDKCNELTGKLCKELGEKTDTCRMVVEQTKQFPPERCAAMMEHYDEVLADLKQQVKKNEPLSAAQQKAIAEGAAPSFGPDDARVTIVEFSDFACPFCSRAAGVVEQIREKYGQKVHFVFRQFPLPMHKQAKGAAEAALAANAQGKFWEYHDRLFANQKELDREGLEKQAQELGLDMARFNQALDQDEYEKDIDRDIGMGKKVAVSGTPTMFINGKRVPNPTSFPLVSKMIDDALES